MIACHLLSFCRQSSTWITIIAILMFLLPSGSWAQQINPDYLNSLQLRNIGPGAMSGRITAITCDPRNPQIIYAGAASGGVWRSKSGGTAWEPIFDSAPTQSVGAIAINPANPDEIWVGTGEGNPRNSQNFGAGIFKSIDGGLHWTCMGLQNTHTIHRIIIHRDNPNIVWVASLGSANGPTADRGVYKTTDGGFTWNKVLYVNDLTGCADLVIDPVNPNKLYASMWEYRRWPWFFKSGGPGSGLYVSFDGGNSWERRTEKNGLPAGELGRIGLAIARSKPDVVYAIVEAKENALYKSTNGGWNWQKMADKDIGGRPFYFAEIYVDPKNENRIYSLHTYLNRSEDGGRTFETWIGWKIHLDHHAFWIHPDDPDFIIDGNDGGLNITHDGGQTWRYAENIPVGQFYHVNVDNDIPYNVYGGLQDNGSFVGPSAVWRSGGIRNPDWQELLFGDGFDVMPRRDDNRYCFAMSQGGELSLVDRKTGRSFYLKPIHPDGISLRWNWNTGLAQDPFHDGGIYFGSQFLHYSPDYGQTWNLVSPDLTTNDTAKLHQDQSGGLTLDATNAENYCTIIAIAPSPAQQGLIWVGTDDGNLQLTRDGGRSWENLAERLPDCPKGAWIPQIEVSAKNAGEAFVVVNNYRQNDWEPYLYHTVDYGRKWKRLASARNITGFCLSVVQDPEVPQLLFLGTDQGLYISLDYGVNWMHWPLPTAQWPNEQPVFPNVPVQDMKIHPRDGDLVIATFGRGIWILDNLAPLRALARDPKLLNQPIRLFEPQTAYLAEWRSYEGTRFSADAIYAAASKSAAARIPVWIKPGTTATVKDEKKEQPDRPVGRGPGGRRSSNSKKEKALVLILNMEGDTIRRFKTEVDTCFGYINWGLDSRGIQFPTNREPEREQEEPGGGPDVPPGSYKIVVEYMGQRDSTQIKVAADPRLNIPLALRRANAEALRKFYPVIEKVRLANERLNKAEKTMKLVEAQTANLPDSSKKDLLDLGKIARDSITAMQESISKTRAEKGITADPDDLNSKLRQALQYIRASPGEPNTNAQIAVKIARQRADEVLGRINEFFALIWPKYREKAEAIKVAPFLDWEE